MQRRHLLRNLLLSCSIFTVLLTAGCASGPTIRSNMDPDIDFNSFHTFGFFQPLSTDREGYQSLISQQLVASAQRELEARGLQRTDTNPDLLINFSANLDQRLRIRQTPGTSMGGMSRHRRGLYSTWPSYQQTDIRQYTQGTLGIDVVHAAKRQLIWEGFAMGRITQSNMDNIDPVLDSAVVDILRDFPLPPK